MITTVGNANEQGQVTRRVRTDGRWGEILVKQPQIFKTYNMKMNAVDRSDQILSALSTQWKCVRWWKTLFFPLIDIAVVNSFICFRHIGLSIQRSKDRLGICICDSCDEIVQEICGFEEYGDPPYLSSREAKGLTLRVWNRTCSLLLWTEEKPCCVL